MTKDELNRALLVERFAPRPRGDRTVSVWVREEPVYDDSQITTRRRRRELDEACDGFDIPRRDTA